VSPNTDPKTAVLETALLDILDILDEALRKIGTIDAHPSTTKDGITTFSENGKVYQLRADGLDCEDEK